MKADWSRRRQECSSEHAHGLRVRALGVSAYFGLRLFSTMLVSTGRAGFQKRKPGRIAGGNRHVPTELSMSVTGCLQPVNGSASMHIGAQRVRPRRRFVNQVLGFNGFIPQDIAVWADGADAETVVNADSVKTSAVASSRRAAVFRPKEAQGLHRNPTSDL